MRKLSIAVLISAVAVMVALTGCGGGGGGGGSKDGGGNTTTGTTIVSGTVVDNRTPRHAVAGVVVDLGYMETVTDANGKFSFNLGVGVAVSSLFASPIDAIFKVSTRLLPADQYPQVSVFYLGVGYPQIAETGGSSIPLPFEVYTAAGVAKDLGMIIVQYNDPSIPPPPPF